jgi:uncharacterized circularly permuted ATP-grasp superfamily protein
MIMEASVLKLPESELFTDYYFKENTFDEVFKKNSPANAYYNRLLSLISSYSTDEFKILNESTKKSFISRGVTFATYSDNPKGNERIFPFDLFPRIIPQSEWRVLEKGLKQRNRAINLFIDDLYHDSKILRDKIVPVDLILSCSNYNRYMKDFKPQGSVYNHISGTDIIKHNDGKYYVLEDNVRCPSGVSYVLANRDAMKKTIPSVFSNFNISPISDYPEALQEMMHSVKSDKVDNPNCVVLTPGAYNSAYYEHSFLAQSMGIELVEGRDMFTDNDFVYMHTVYGAKRVDVIYRRIDDDFIDPLVFRPDSALGVPGLMSAYRKGNVTILNAPGTGIADDKAVYAYIPEIIKYYLDEEPILNNVPTYRCDVKQEMDYVLEHIAELVVKPVDQSGGYGIFIGNQATQAQIEEQKNIIKSHPRGYIAQPTMSLSVHSTFIEDENKFEPRHIDLRTYTLLSPDKEFVLKGGLSRVALKKGNLIVNSSQGGGSKDTWVMEE